jgi:O-antigen ligase
VNVQILGVNRGPQITLTLCTVLFAIVLGVEVVRSPLALLALLGIFATCVITTHLPEIPLGLGVFATLTTDRFAAASQAGHVVLIAAGGTAGILLLGERGQASPRLLAPFLLAMSWLALRLGMGSGLGTVRPFVSCAASVLLATLCLVRKRDWLPSMAWPALAFITASLLLGVLDPTGKRFEGISGNPNRMVFGCLVAMPLLAAILLRGRLMAKLLMGFGLVVATRLVFVSGSDQGIAGMALLVFLVAVYASRRVNAGLVAIVLLAALGVAIIVSTMSTFGTLSPDVATLSGRTLTYRASLHEFAQHPIIGSGTQHVTLESTVDRSAHNSILGIAAASGTVGALLWLVVLIGALRSSVSRIRSGDFAAASAVAVFMSQLVQSVEVVPLAWAALLLTASPVWLARDADDL